MGTEQATSLFVRPLRRVRTKVSVNAITVGKSIFPSSLTGNVYTAIPLFFSDAHALPTE